MARSLLVVEDDGLIRMDLADTLTDLGFEVTEAGNADEAVKLFEEGPPFSALITDIDMPGTMNGIALANRIADHFNDCRIFVISGRYHPGQGQLPREAHFLVKPVSEDALKKAFVEAKLVP